jgi:hypothetical protein
VQATAVLPAAAIALGLAVSLSACSAGAPTPSPVTSSGTGSATPTPTPSSSAAPALVPGGTAAQNLPYFDQVNKATIAANPGAQGRAFIDGLVAAGFPKADMQVTADTTTIGLKANSIQFSVRLGQTCLIGQYGADAGGYQSTTSAALATGGCLIGQTRPIDW